jgi:DNA transposition AAA+ family ATPase
MITQELKQRIVQELALRRANFEGSDNKFAVSLNINAAQYNRIKNGETERVISDSNWISLARMLDMSLTNERPWQTAETPVFVTITKQLTLCQNEAMSCMICDAADIGKTYAAKYYVKQNKNAVYVDCSQVKSKQKLIRYIAKEYGVNHSGKYADVYADLIFYIKSIPSPVVILDEAGDLQYDAFLELKALWNATEKACGWCMIGADGLKEKVRRAIDCKKVGYTEIFSRYGKRYQRITPEGKEEQKDFTTLQAVLILKANAPASANLQKLITQSEGSLRRIYHEISKL